ncbi:MarR family winged helix-turn-helix transcriptional regulator [Nakamurella endophytica]|uniref:MarR family transcriptional regulator n=1 Tax=Nakamurella endophytica TaxID=1748367 RepID=A0A917SP29_9ACTN|nr:MarR family transcriptional regulator [Nakamurella endophytica]GGL92004.1 MarR family transcriptional regulator [Nakamurella endophytica]
MRTASRRSGPDPFAGQVEAILAASRVLVGVSAQSLAAVEDRVSVAQFRLLVILASRGTLGLNALAEAMGVHPSNATRACDRLVGLGLLDRRENPADRRQLALALTPAGVAVVQEVMTARRAAIAEILERVPAGRREGVGEAMQILAVAGGEPDPAQLWALGWTAAPEYPSDTGQGAGT